jgi:hypothetical protein
VKVVSMMGVTGRDETASDPSPIATA